MGNLKTSIVLFGLLLVILLANLIATKMRASNLESEYVLTGAIFPELIIDDISRIEMSRGDEKLTLIRSENDWLIEQQYQYPAKAGMIQELLNSLRRYNSATVYSDKPELHSEFSCTEDTGVSVVIHASDKIVANFIAGKPSFTPTTGYIRKVNDNRVLEVYGNNSKLYNPRPLAWLNTKIFTLKPEDIYSIKVSSPNADPFELVVSENVWKFVPDSVEVPNPQSCGLLAQMFSGIVFKEVISGVENLVEKQLDPPLWEFEITTQGSETHKLLLGAKKDNSTYYAMFDEGQYVLSIDKRFVEKITTDRAAIVRGDTPKPKTQPKRPHPTKYAVEGKGQPLPKVKIVTNKGDVVIELWEDDAPNTVANFIYLAEKGFYNGLSFHRHEPGLVLQGGCPLGTGMGNPGWSIEAEVNSRKYNLGVLGMADSGVDTGGSQFFFSYKPMPHWDGRYTKFGVIVEGRDVFAKLEKGDSIVRIEVLSKRNHEYRPYVTKEGSTKEERLPALKKK